MSVLIGVTPDTHSGRKLKTRTPKEEITYLWDQYLQALLDNKALATLLPVTLDKQLIQKMLQRLDGIVLAGGNFDVPPEFFGEEIKPWLGKLKPKRSKFELELLKAAMKKNMPILGICGGMQIINVAFGGTLYQDIKEERPASGNHQQTVRKDKTSHQVKLAPGTRLYRMMTGKKGKTPLPLRVNSTHHQAIKDLGQGLTVNAVATDGIVEGVESRTHRFLVGIQWHPELLYPEHKDQNRIFSAFIRAAKTR